MIELQRCFNCRFRKGRLCWNDRVGAWFVGNFPTITCNDWMPWEI